MPVVSFSGIPYSATLIYSEPCMGKSTYVSTMPKPMKVYFFDAKNKEAPYLKRGKIIEEGVTQAGVPFVKVGRKSDGQHIITIEYFRNAAPEKPTAYPLFLKSMTKIHEDYDYYETFVLDSVTYLEKSARWYDQFVLNVDAKHKGQHYILSAEVVEQQIMGRWPSLPKHSVAVCHVLEKKNKDGEDVSKVRFGSKNLFVPAAPGAKAKQLPSAYSEIYRAYVDPTSNKYLLQTKTDGMWLAATQINAPNPCESRFDATTSNWKGFDAE